MFDNTVGIMQYPVILLRVMYIVFPRIATSLKQTPASFRVIRCKLSHVAYYYMHYAVSLNTSLVLALGQMLQKKQTPVRVFK